jgi:hypothetical protein
VLDLIADLLVAADREKAGEVWRALLDRLASSMSIFFSPAAALRTPDDPCWIARGNHSNVGNFPRPTSIFHAVADQTAEAEAQS